MKYLAIILLFCLTSCITNNEIGTVKAYDTNPGQKLTYKLISGNADNTFSINNSGVITFNKQPPGTEYILTIRVTDDGKMWNGDTYFQDTILSSTATITILKSAWTK